MRTLPNTPQAGLVIVTAGFLIAPGMDVFAKFLTQTLSPGMVVVGRFAVQSMLLIPLILVASQWGRPGLGHLLAGMFLGLALLCINAALAVMPIANAIAIFFVEPLILTLLSAAILGERIGWRRIVAVLVGLVGALIVIRPNWEEYGIAAILPLGTALFFAGYVLVTRVMTRHGKLLSLQFWTGLAAMCTLLAAAGLAQVMPIPAVALDWPSQDEMLLFLGMGALAVLTHQMLALALARLEASVVAPMQYLEIVSATLFGWMFFRDFPDALTLLGAAIIISSGVYVFHRERKQAVAT